MLFENVTGNRELLIHAERGSIDVRVLGETLEGFRLAFTSSVVTELEYTIDGRLAGREYSNRLGKGRNSSILKRSIARILDIPRIALSDFCTKQQKLGRNVQYGYSHRPRGSQFH
jgi:hypothetical protein